MPSRRTLRLADVVRRGAVRSGSVVVGFRHSAPAVRCARSALSRVRDINSSALAIDVVRGDQQAGVIDGASYLHPGLFVETSVLVGLLADHHQSGITLVVTRSRALR